MNKRLKSKGFVYREVSKSMMNTIKEMGIKNLYQVNEQQKNDLIDFIQACNSNDCYKSYLVDVKIANDSPITEAISYDFMTSLTDEINIMTMMAMKELNTAKNVIATDISSASKEDLEIIIDKIEDAHIENIEKHYLYFTINNTEDTNGGLWNSLRARVKEFSIKISVNEDNIKLLFDKIFENLSIDITEAEKSLVLNAVDGDFRKIPDVISDLIAK